MTSLSSRNGVNSSSTSEDVVFVRSESAIWSLFVWVAPQVVVSELRRDVMTAIYLTGTIGTHSMTWGARFFFVEWAISMLLYSTKCVLILGCVLSLLEGTFFSLGWKRHGTRSLRCSWAEFFFRVHEWTSGAYLQVCIFFLVHSSAYLLLSK